MSKFFLGRISRKYKVSPFVLSLSKHEQHRRAEGERVHFSKGLLLINLTMFMAILLILTGALVTLCLADLWGAQRSQASLQAFYLAEGAIDQGFKWLREQPGPPGGAEALVLEGGWQDLGEGSLMVVVDPDDNNPDSYVKRYTIQGWGSAYDQAVPMAVRQNALMVQVESFARYAYLTDDELSPTGSTVWFVGWDHIGGPTHTNGQFSMFDDPTFDGLVTSVSDEINYFDPPPEGGNNPNFNDGLQLGAEEKPFPTRIPPALIEAAQADGIALQGDTSVTMLASGQLQVTNQAAGMNSTQISIPDNGVLYVENGDVTLQGTMHGQMTVAATGDIEIPDSILYADDPRENPESQDLLGILAAGNVVIDSNAPSDLEIDGTIMALETSFIVENWKTGPAKGTLTVFGGINQEKRGPVGTFSSRTNTKRSGYSKEYNYDTRLRNMIPPFFPLTGDYNTLAWDDPGIVSQSSEGQ